MGPLKMYDSETVRVWFKKNGRLLTSYDEMENFSHAYFITQTVEIGANGFKVTGMYHHVPLHLYRLYFLWATTICPYLELL